MGSHGLCTQTQVGFENSRLRWKDCIVLFVFIFKNGVILEGVIRSKGHIMRTVEFGFGLINRYIYYHVSVWALMYKQRSSVLYVWWIVLFMDCIL